MLRLRKPICYKYFRKKLGDDYLLQIVCAIEHDGRNERVLTLAFDVPSQDFDLHTAIQETVKDYLSTDEGKKVWTYNCHNFNWADFAMHIDSASCERHGFSLIGSEQYSDRIVNWDEDLAGLFASDSDGEC